jgi:hypothetical protein
METEFTDPDEKRLLDFDRVLTEILNNIAEKRQRINEAVNSNYLYITGQNFYENDCKSINRLELNLRGLYTKCALMDILLHKYQQPLEQEGVPVDEMLDSLIRMRCNLNYGELLQSRKHLQNLVNAHDSASQKDISGIKPSAYSEALVVLVAGIIPQFSAVFRHYMRINEIQ